MPFNFLLDEFPDEVVVEKVAYRVRCDFKSILAIMQLFNDTIFSDDEKLLASITMFYENKIPSNIMQAYVEMLKFIKVYDQIHIEQDNKNETKILDFSIDSGRIYSAFIQIYKIDLSIENMHWFKFKCLLENVNDGKPRLLQVMEIRDMDIDNSLPTKQKVKLRKLKKEYSLEKQEDISNAFANSFFLGVKGGVKVNDK